MKHQRRRGILLADMKLLGTNLSLKEGQRVSLIPALNQPDKTQFFAMPLYGMWKHNGKKWQDYESSILIKKEDVRIYY